MKKKFLDLLKQLTIVDWILIVGVALGLLLVAFSVLTKMLEKPTQVEYLASDTTPSTTSVGTGGQAIWVDVGGAVVNPGVYRLDRESRVKDAIVAAGGLSDKADRDYVSKVVNLAAIVKDGEKIYVPEKDNTPSRPPSTLEGGVRSKLVNINTATKVELQTLWGVGEARAEAIIAARPYQSIEELLNKKILPSNVFEKNKGKMSVY